jgi:hypothetical protein
MIRLLAHIINLFLFSNIYFALIIALACYTTSKSFQIPVDTNFLYFIFFSTCCSYCMHWAIPITLLNVNARDEWNVKNRVYLFSLSVLCLCLGLYFFTLLPSNVFQYIIPLVFFTLLYTVPKINYKPFIFLRKLVIAKTTYLSLVLVYTTVVLPMLLNKYAFTINVLWYLCIRFIIIYIICFLFDYRDCLQDEFQGVQKYLAKQSIKLKTRLLQFLSIIGFITAFLAMYFNAIPVSNCNLMLQSFVPLLILLFIIPKALRSTNIYLYYGILDGLLAIHIIGLLCS